MNTSIPNPTVDDLTSLLFSGLQETLTVAGSQGVLQPPYGRPKVLTPQDIEDKINAESSSDEEEDAEDDGADDVADESDEEVEFEYNYGFVSEHNNPARLGAPHCLS